MSQKSLINPLSNNYVFGEIDSLNLDGIITDKSPIHLPQGKHVGPHKGFGAKHIFAEHHKEMAALKLYDITDVPIYICKIVCSGTPLYFEGSSWRNTRLMAVKTSHGTAILEYRDRRDGAIWSIVTAYSTPKKHGVEVGKII